VKSDAQYARLHEWEVAIERAEDLSINEAIDIAVSLFDRSAVERISAAYSVASLTGRHLFADYAALIRSTIP
jgi:hypothetical protein